MPFSIPETRKYCVENHGKEWLRRYDAIIAAAEEVVVVESGDASEMAASSAHYRYTNHQLLGMASLRASRISHQLQPLVVWNGSDAEKPALGGTGDFVAQACSLDTVPIIVSPDDGTLTSGVQVPPPQPLTDKLDSQRRIRIFLFADVKGFSTVAQDELQKVSASFLTIAANILHGKESGMILCNTWGDALYAVFDSVERAAETALRLRDEVRFQVGEGELRLRISLHAGPVFVGHDPVIDNEAYVGNNVIRAARMEPIAEVGQVLVSDEFAALLATSSKRQRYAFHYLGLARLPKGYGRIPAFELERLHQSRKSD